MILRTWLVIPIKFIIYIGILMTVIKNIQFYLKQNHEIKTVQPLNDLIPTYFVCNKYILFCFILLTWVVSNYDTFLNKSPCHSSNKYWLCNNDQCQIFKLKLKFLTYLIFLLGNQKVQFNKSWTISLVDNFFFNTHRKHRVKRPLSGDTS